MVQDVGAHARCVRRFLFAQTDSRRRFYAFPTHDEVVTVELFPVDAAVAFDGAAFR